MLWCNKEKLSADISIEMLGNYFNEKMAKTKVNKQSLKKDKHYNDFDYYFLHTQIELQERVFQQIGKELHDNIGQLLSTSRMLITLAERSIKKPPDPLLTANATLAKAIAELRRLYKFIDNDRFFQFDLIKNINLEVAKINAAGNIIVSTDLSCTPFLSSSKQVILFKAILDVLENAVNSRNCRNIQIHLSAKNNLLIINISDDSNTLKSRKSKELFPDDVSKKVHLLEGSIKYYSSAKKNITTIQIPQSNADDKN